MTYEEINDIEVRWEDIPINGTEEVQDRISYLCSEEKIKLKEFINKNFDSISLQFPCDLNCYSCSVPKVIECYYLDNRLRFNHILLPKTKPRPPLKEEIKIRQHYLKRVQDIAKHLKNM